MIRILTGLAVAAVVVASSCGYFEQHEETSAPTGTRVEALQALRIEKLDQLYGASDPETGWPSKDDCDGTLWAGLAAGSGASWVQFRLAERSPGVIHRRPTPCWTPEQGDVGSKATTSPDMLTGYLFAVWRLADLPAAQRLADYGRDHDWVMGEPYPEQAARVRMTSNLQGLLGQILYRLSDGTDTRDIRFTPLLYLPVLEDYERHIQTVGILIAGELTHGLELDVNGLMLDRLEANASSDPKDAFLAAALGRYTGDQEHALDLLLDPAYECPSYVRGAAAYCLVHWLVAADTALR